VVIFTFHLVDHSLKDIRSTVRFRDQYITIFTTTVFFSIKRENMSE